MENKFFIKHAMVGLIAAIGLFFVFSALSLKINQASINEFNKGAGKNLTSSYISIKPDKDGLATINFGVSNNSNNQLPQSKSKSTLKIARKLDGSAQLQIAVNQITGSITKQTN